ncbi:uncharacterized protein Z519_07562 [Cladophialophora bantiana CBS 173.52]|uniref:Uncharacterized protein n=1 Tax=Cladophialophora bantiana (strain ATCC 10958 / CBS 173.52 / CDC B-1940 / NIH 8579) TaxID=1442370 RepID=A0A0D2HLF9_CLAB1|nr:uncharacterized protein Z519_07562 [Cladophialophora bantiana CBS 173.52]KIW91595.1 hypothetical protein Z519_07562 [Cladophialophora bantiana CBS 173.52]
MANATEETEKRKLLRKYNIFFDLNEPQAPGPEAYFEDIRALGDYSLDQYRSSINIESRQKPWRQNILRRAYVISAKARRCLDENKNELSWRLNIESDILARFSIEVAW